MTDRELLELAAKAAGFKIEFRPAATRNIGGSLKKFEVVAWHGPFFDASDDEWNPLTDDGDALRLAVLCGIAVVPYPIYEWPKHSVIAARKSLDESRIAAGEPHNGDPYAATRSAIVRAAAEIGKGMK